MKIDRNNYQVWLIDMIDGNLSEEQAAMLRIFLNENPDIEAELDGLDAVVVNPEPLHFNYRKKLSRRPEDISDQQFEILSVACLENDISPDQKAELEKILEFSTARRAEFELIQKIRLSPGKTAFRNRKKLIRLSPATIRLRYMAAITSAAAAVALFFYLFYSSPSVPLNNTAISDAGISPVKTEPLTAPVPIDAAATGTTGITADKPKAAAHAEPGKEYQPEAENVTVVTIQDTEAEIERLSAPARADIPDSKNIKIAYAMTSGTLMECPIEVKNEITEAEGSSVGRFLARNFRSKVLREEEAGDKPLKGYEIAEAGVNGLNKLLGWEMALNTNTGMTGEVESVYFSSRLIKINAPVKKTEQKP